MRKHLAHITWEWGLKESKAFDSKEERELFLDRNEESIEKVVTQFGRINPPAPAPEDPFYSIMRNWSEYEMDIYL